MRLDQIDPELIRHAVRVFVEEAWGADWFEEKLPAEKLTGDSAEAILDHFDDETDRRGASGMRRYTLRIGNVYYPHMKFVVQEVLLEDEFFLSVDTHDDIEADPSLPDYEAWCALREHNLAVKDAIEARWRELFDLKTCAELVDQRTSEAGVGEGRKILVVDDEHEIADAVAKLLEAEGYSVRIAYDGEEALAAVRAFEPELLILDYQMPGLDGVEVCRRLRKREETRDLPILLSTAAMIDLSVFGRLASGFLLKPYHREWLLGFVSRHLP